jgi:hypothetical protein
MIVSMDTRRVRIVPNDGMKTVPAPRDRALGAASDTRRSIRGALEPIGCTSPPGRDPIS